MIPINIYTSHTPNNTIDEKKAIVKILCIKMYSFLILTHHIFIVGKYGMLMNLTNTMYCKGKNMC